MSALSDNQKAVVLSSELLDRIVSILVKEANPEKIILFGSHARGDAHKNSDIDLLVIENSVQSQRAEMVRLQRALSPLRLPVEVHVTELARLSTSWADFPGSYLYHALREGKILYALDRASQAVTA